MIPVTVVPALVPIAKKSVVAIGVVTSMISEKVTVKSVVVARVCGKAPPARTTVTAGAFSQTLPVKPPTIGSFTVLIPVPDAFRFKPIVPSPVPVLTGTV